MANTTPTTHHPAGESPGVGRSRRPESSASTANAPSRTVQTLCRMRVIIRGGGGGGGSFRRLQADGGAGVRVVVGREGLGRGEQGGAAQVVGGAVAVQLQVDLLDRVLGVVDLQRHVAVVLPPLEVDLVLLGVRLAVELVRLGLPVHLALAVFTLDGAAAGERGVEGDGVVVLFSGGVAVRHEDLQSGTRKEKRAAE